VVTYTLVTLAADDAANHLGAVHHLPLQLDPGQNGAALFCVGLTAAVVQAGLLGVLIKRFGEVRLSVLGMVSGAVTYLLYGLATQGWMMYVLILCNVLSFAIGPALQSIISKETPPNEQGELMGSLQSISSVGVIFMPRWAPPFWAKSATCRRRLAHRQHVLPVRRDADAGHLRGAALLRQARGASMKLAWLLAALIAQNAAAGARARLPCRCRPTAPASSSTA
jgi:MFS family permease